MAERSRKFFGNLDEWSPEFAAAALDRFDAFQKQLKDSKRHDRIKRMWSTVFMRDRDGGCDETTIGSGGRRGEALFVTPNRLGRLVRDHITMVSQTKSLPEPIAANSDARSQDQVALAKGICEHYKREADLEGIKTERSFVAEICGDSYLHVPWDADLGNEVAVVDAETTGDPEVVEPGADTGETGNDDDTESSSGRRIVYEGDYSFSVRTPYDVAFERSSAKRKRPGWQIVADPVNRYDLLKQVEEEVTDEATRKRLEHAILNAPAWSERNNDLGFDKDRDDYDDLIAVYFVYIERCRACPSGRFAKVIDRKTVFLDGPLIDPRAPVFRLSQGEVLFRNEATTPNHDGLPLADALTAQMSTILSNHANHGMMRVIAPREANLLASELDEGASSINYDHVDKAGNTIPAPTPWAPDPGSDSLYNFYSMLASELDLVAGGSPVTRGDPNATQGDSGSKVAALFAAAQNVASSFVATVLRSEEELYTYLVESLKLRATSKRVVTIVGEHNTFQAKEYTADKISGIARVKVQQADAMRDTLQGRVAMVELLSGKPPQEQRQIIGIMQTGIASPVTDETEPARLLLERENEDLRNPDAPMPVLMVNDNHVDHWRSHMNQANSPEARRDERIRMRIETHAKEHEMAIDPTSPKFVGMPSLLMSGQKPLPMEAPQQAPRQASPTDPQAAAHAAGQAQSDAAKQRRGPDLPNAPQMPVNPTSGERMQSGGMGQPQAPKPSPMGLGA